MKRCASLLLYSLAALGLLAGCSEDVDSSARYVFEELTAMGYLEKYADVYSSYLSLLHSVHVSSRSETTMAQLLSARGHYTVFAPTNDAVRRYLETLVDEGILSEPSWDAFTDSSVVAGLCAEALGVDRVIGVTMPNGVQPDIDDSMKLINHLGIRHCCVNIGDTYNTLIAAVKEQLGTLDAEVSRQTTINLPPRLRMSTLYAVSQSMNGRVANTCNLSEDWVGYSTRYGDAAGDFAPLGGLTVQEVKAIGKELGLPIELVEKTPSDGLTNKSDEDNLGFTYAVLDNYIRTGVCNDPKTKALIDHKHITNLFKLQPIPHFEMK